MVTFGEPLEHVITPRGLFFVSRTDDHHPCVHSKRFRVYIHNAPAYASNMSHASQQTHTPHSHPHHTRPHTSTHIRTETQPHPHQHPHPHTTYTTQTHTTTQNEKKTENETDVRWPHPCAPLSLSCTCVRREDKTRWKTRWKRRWQTSWCGLLRKACLHDKAELAN